jgi:hypothetical protein
MVHEKLPSLIARGLRPGRSDAGCGRGAVIALVAVWRSPARRPVRAGDVS